MTTELRPLRKEDWNVWYDNLVRAFGGTPEPPEERELWQALTPYDRSVGVWEGDQCVGTAGAFDFRLAVPGGSVVPAAGVTMVGVAATHRRRGVLTSMMRRQLDDIRSWGEPLAVLTASEPAIYGRFGYGLATRRLTADIDTARVRLSVPPGGPAGRRRTCSTRNAIATGPRPCSAWWPSGPTATVPVWSGTRGSGSSPTGGRAGRRASSR